MPAIKTKQFLSQSADEMIMVIHKSNLYFFRLNGKGVISPTTFEQIVSTFKFASEDAKACSTDVDCNLLVCSGCFNKEWLKTAPPDNACMDYADFTCKCVNHVCTP